MNCYICEQTKPTYTLHEGTAPAVGICHDCGIGVCAQHGFKDPAPGAPLLCHDCTVKRKTVATMPRLSVAEH